MVSQDSVYYRKEELKDYTIEELQTELKKRIKEKTMTRLEKARELNPHLKVSKILDKCPHNILPNLRAVTNPWYCHVITCKECWDIEYKEE